MTKILSISNMQDSIQVITEKKNQGEKRFDPI